MSGYARNSGFSTLATLFLAAAVALPTGILLRAGFNAIVMNQTQTAMDDVLNGTRNTCGRALGQTKLWKLACDSRNTGFGRK